MRKDTIKKKVIFLEFLHQKKPHFIISINTGQIYIVKWHSYPPIQKKRTHKAKKKRLFNSTTNQQKRSFPKNGEPRCLFLTVELNRFFVFPFGLKAVRAVNIEEFPTMKEPKELEPLEESKKQFGFQFFFGEFRHENKSNIWR